MAGSLVVTDGDIANGRFVYAITNTGANFNVPVANALSSSTSMEFRNEGSANNYASYYRAYGGSTTAQMTLKFDFSQTSYRPTEVTLSDRLHLFNNDNGNSYTLITRWSIDGINWTTIKSLTSTGIGSVISDVASNTISLSGADTFYYSFYAVANTGTFPTNAVEWGRGTSGQSVFSADFNLTPVPEPSTLAFLGLCGGLMLLGMRQRRQPLN